jgi:hypothetical protein
MSQWFGIELDDPSEDQISQPLNTYLAKSLNMELINIILQGISKFADEDYKPQEEGLFNYYEDGLGIRKMKLDRIEISDASNLADNPEEKASVYIKRDKMKE